MQPFEQSRHCRACPRRVIRADRQGSIACKARLAAEPTNYQADGARAAGVHVWSVHVPSLASVAHISAKLLHMLVHISRAHNCLRRLARPSVAADTGDAPLRYTARATGNCLNFAFPRQPRTTQTPSTSPGAPPTQAPKR